MRAIPIDVPVLRVEMQQRTLYRSLVMKLEDVTKTEIQEIFGLTKATAIPKVSFAKVSKCRKSWNVHLKSSFRKVRERERYDSD